MTEREKALEGLDLMIGFCDTMTRVCYDGDKATYEEQLEILKAAKKALEQVDYDADIVWKCRLGQIKKYVGRGVVILNYDWWIEQLGRKKDCQPVPDWEEVVELAEPAGWVSVKERLPEEGVRVLAVKKLKDGRRDLALATCIPEYKHHDYVTGEDIVEPYWVCGGNNNITHWMPLPEMPEEGTGGK